ncbi:MAG: DUF2797 domain-containing protein [Deltaproteobacteria bacterium]|nr:DUF2797 domain-containing protein [Deltaproteobacteria bacterium]
MPKSKLGLRKLKHSSPPKLQYELLEHKLNDLVGAEIKFTYTGQISCINCERKIKKTFNQGYCYPCFQTLARCDTCLVKPELCHYSKGTCREPKWGEEHCLIPHYVYLANTTGLKVGVTRGYQLFTRWGDQGAISAVVLAKVPERLVAGELEVAIKEHLNDKTNWRKLLKGEFEELDLLTEKTNLLSKIPSEFKDYLILDGEESDVYGFQYPVESYLDKAKTHNFDKTPVIEGILHGIHGQYLFIGDAGLNIRKFQGYEVEFTY